MSAKTDAERRKLADLRKKEAGLYKPTVWVKRENGPLIQEIAKELESDIADYKITRGPKKTTITIEH